MKKLTSILLALVMMMSLSTVAFADEAGNVEGTDMSTITITKDYEATNTGTTSPAETFAFTIVDTSVSDAADGVTNENMPTPTVGTVSYSAGEAGSSAMSKDITVSLPTYNSVGIYTYTIKETASNTAGVTYYANDIILVVTVQQDSDGKIRVAAVHTEDGANGTEVAGTKKDNFPNVYSAGSLKVSKTVTGNLGDQTKEFNVTVEFTVPEGKTVNEAISYTDGTESKTIATTAWINNKASVVITLKHGETVTFTNIPYDVTYTVVEDDYTTEAGGQYDPAVYAFSDEANKKIDSAEDTVMVTNNKGVIVDTGIGLDSIPYIMILVIAVGGLFVFVNKRRMANED